MAGYVSRTSADRWNHAARIVAAAGAGSRFLPGMYREPRGSAVSCTDLPSPGSYPATVGASIAAGATGAIVYDGVVYTVKNHSSCDVIIGNLAGFHISPTCEAFFVPCVCCDQEPPTACCDKFIAICINQRIEIVAVDGGTATWTLTGCCECDSTPTLEITLSCETTTITADWEYQCGATVVTGSLDYSGLCDDPVVEPVDTITPDGCSIVISASIDAEQCLPCEPYVPPPDCTCCFELIPWSAAECDKSEVPDFVDDIGLTAVGTSVDPWCNGVTLTLTLTYTNNSGGDYSGASMRFDATSNLPTGSRPVCVSASDSGTITDDAPGSGFSVEWTAGAWANGVSLVRTLQITHSGCTPGSSQIQADVYAGLGYRCAVTWSAVACP